MKHTPLLARRRSGILMPIFSLPSPYGIGTFGKAAYDFVDFLKKAGQSYWQILPLGYQQAQAGVTSALGRLIAVSENYPDLKANQNFLELQAQLEGTENRITVARKAFNDTTQQYNVSVRSFPANIIAMIFGFDQKPYYEADESAATAPKVEF